MDIIFFDLDGTLLNKDSQLSEFTKETLAMLNEKGIANTVATGRTMVSANYATNHHRFHFPHIYSNGVAMWDPDCNALTLANVLSKQEVDWVLQTAEDAGIISFVNTVDINHAHHEHVIYHSAPKHRVEQAHIDTLSFKKNARLASLNNDIFNYDVTNISMIGKAETIRPLHRHLNQYDTLVAYSGPAADGEDVYWLDVHHKLATKGGAVKLVKERFGASNVICFGDGDNDLSMFDLADEAYAPSNALDIVKQHANDVIGHHNDDAVAHFLRERFSL
jgi:Cof subfamily protein (haloacid dehalogenase superfamily)